MDEIRYAIPLGALIANAGYTRKAIAKELGVSQRTLNKWLSGEAHPDSQQRSQLAQLLRMDTRRVNTSLFAAACEWAEYQERLKSNRNDKRNIRQLVIETIVQLLVSVIASLIVTLKMLGRF